jgi:hypothetical protein
VGSFGAAVKADRMRKYKRNKGLRRSDQYGAVQE